MVCNAWGMHAAMRICFIGDSFVNGTGDGDCLGWVGRLCSEARRRGHDLTCYNLGIRRDTSHHIAARWEREAMVRLPPEQDGRLIFSFGVNDCVHDAAEKPRVHADKALANIRSIVTRAKQRWPILMVGPPCTGKAALDQRVKGLSDRMQRLCQELSVPFRAVFPHLEGDAVWRHEARQGDGVHPNRGGYTLLCDAVLT